MKIQLNHQKTELTKKLNYCLVLSLCFILILIPHLNLEGYINSTVTSKFIGFSYSCLIVSLLFFARLLVSKKVVFSLTSIDLGFLVLYLYLILNRYVLQDVHGFSIRYIELLGLSILYLILRTFSLKSFYWLLLVIVVSGIIQAVYGNLQLLGYHPSYHSGFKMTGSFFNPGPFAGFLASVWPVALGMYLFKEKIIIQVQNQLNSNSQIIKGFTKYSFEYVPLLGLISILLVIPASQSRASWLAVMVSTIVLLEYKYAFSKKLLKNISILKKGLLIVFSIIIFSAGLFGIFHFKKASATGRLFVWKVTTEMISDSPFFGVGFDRFKTHYMNYQAKYFEQNGQTQESLVADNTYYAFNEGIQFVSENGVIGFILLSIIIYLIFTQPLQANYNNLGFILKACLLSISIFACFSYPTQILPIKLVLMAALTILSSLSLKKYEVVNFNEPTNMWLFKGLVLVAGIGVCLNGFTYTQKLGKGFIIWNDAFELYGYGLYQEAIEEYKLAYPAFQNDGDFLMNYGKALTMLGNNKEAVKILNDAKQQLNTTIIQTALGDAYKEVKYYEKAEQAYKHAANMIPSRFYPNYLLAKLFDENNQSLKALKVAKQLLEKDIKIPSTAVVEIQQEMKEIIEKYNEK